jgi:hypothetical protein
MVGRLLPAEIWRQWHQLKQEIASVGRDYDPEDPGNPNPGRDPHRLLEEFEAKHGLDVPVDE